MRLIGKRKLVVVGNGATAVDSISGRYINRHTGAFLTSLAGCGFRVVFLQPRAVYRQNENLHDFALSEEAVESVAIDTSGRLKLLRTLALALWQVVTADLVYIFYPGTLPQAIGRLCSAIGKPFGLYLRGEQFSTGGSGLQVLREAEFIVTVSTTLTKAAYPLGGRVIPIRPMLDISPDDVLRRDFANRGKGPWQVLFVGRLEESKGVRDLIEAALILESRGWPFCLTLVGGGPLYENLATQYGNTAGASIRVAGQIADKTQLMLAYGAADFLVLPSHHEGFPRVLYEAMIKSTVILCTMVGGIPGLMDDGQNCIAIPSGNGPAIADALELISACPERMQRLADNGLTTVLNVLATYPSHLDAVKEELSA